ncbi:MAG: hypothetical protein IJ000_00490 [Paludibacteraceae bacterium]|nr:hypothetical protein [Paludibacteraceae bacterium]
MSLPQSLLLPVEGFRVSRAEGQHMLSFNYMLDFFEVSAQYMAIELMALLRQEIITGKEPSKEVLTVVNKIDKKRPLAFGDWCNEMLPQLLQACQQMRIEHPLAIALLRAFKSRNLYIGNKREQSIVAIRNEYRGHGFTLADEIYADLVEKMLPRFEELISLLDNVEIHMDADTLYPMVHTSEEGYPFVFQTLKNEEASFVSTHKGAVTYIGEKYNQQIDQWLQVIMPSFDIARSLNYKEYAQLMQDRSTMYLNSIYSQRKYNRELYVQREQAEKVYHDFITSEQEFFPLLGEPGQGKTNQLCYWTEQFIEQGEAVLTFAGTEFIEQSLEMALREIFQWSYKKSITKLVEELQTKMSAEGKCIYIFFDAINECLHYAGHNEGSNGPLELFQDIVKIFGVVKENSVFRILMTCRNYTWVQHIQPECKHLDMSKFYAVGKEEDLAIRGFSDTELIRAYAIYGSLYQMQTRYEEIGQTILVRLKDPLILKIACTNFLGKVMGESSLEYSSIQLFTQMSDSVASSYAGKNQRKILSCIGKCLLMQYEQGFACDTVYLSTVRKSKKGTPLEELKNLLYGKDGISVAFAELLSKPERPMLRLVDDEKLQFVYERYMEYIMAVEYYDKYKAEDGSLSPDGIYNTIKHAAMTEVMVAVLRNAVLMDFINTGTNALIIELVKKYGNDFIVKSLVHNCMNMLVIEHYEARLFALLTDMLDRNEGMNGAIERYNTLDKLVSKGKADDKMIAQYSELSEQLAPIMRIRSVANQTLVNGVFLTDYFNKNMYTISPYVLLDKAMTQNINEMRDQMCMYIYYLVNKQYTHSHQELQQNLTYAITEYMLDYVCNIPLWRLPLIGIKRIKLLLSYLENGIRLKVMLIIENMLAEQRDAEKVRALYGDIVSVFKHLTLNYSLVRIVTPFLTPIMRKQFTQTMYCNNVIEYQGMWEDNYIPVNSVDNRWNRDDIVEVAEYFKNYSYYMGPTAPKKGEQPLDFSKVLDKVFHAYYSGDALSYFFLERVLVVQYLVQPELVIHLFKKIQNSEIPGSRWWDYTQMSLIYSLYQIGMQSDNMSEDLWKIMSEWCEDWTNRMRGYYEGRLSKKVNSMKLYKRNVMAWYCMVYCKRNGGDKHDKNAESVPLMRKLIDTAIKNRDKELLMHLLQNINELITDAGYIYTAKDLLYYVMEQIPNVQTIEEFENNVNNRYPDTQESIVAMIGRILGTAKLKFSQQINEFLKKETVGLSFPGLPQYSETLLSYNPESEKFSDLITHKFGNFVIKSIINEPVIDDVIVDICKPMPKVKSADQWISQAVKVVFKYINA